MQRLAILGSSDLGQQIAYHVQADRQYDPVGFFDDFQPPGTQRQGLPVLGGMGDVARTYGEGRFDCLLVGIGYNHLRFKGEVYDRFAGTVPFGRFVHSSCVVDPSASIGAGAVLYPGCVIDRNVAIGENALLNLGCIVSHDGRIGRDAFLSPGVTAAGLVEIGAGCFIGVGTTLVDNVRLAAGVRTAGGTVVHRSLDRPGLYAGVPAAWKKE